MWPCCPCTLPRVTHVAPQYVAYLTLHMLQLDQHLKVVTKLYVATRKYSVSSQIETTKAFSLDQHKPHQLTVLTKLFVVKRWSGCARPRCVEAWPAACGCTRLAWARHQELGLLAGLPPTPHYLLKLGNIQPSAQWGFSGS